MKKIFSWVMVTLLSAVSIAHAAQGAFVPAPKVPTPIHSEVIKTTLNGVSVDATISTVVPRAIDETKALAAAMRSVLTGRGWGESVTRVPGVMFDETLTMLGTAVATSKNIGISLGNGAVSIKNFIWNKNAAYTITAVTAALVMHHIYTYYNYSHTYTGHADNKISILHWDQSLLAALLQTFSTLSIDAYNKLPAAEQVKIWANYLKTLTKETFNNTMYEIYTMARALYSRETRYAPERFCGHFNELTMTVGKGDDHKSTLIEMCNPFKVK